MASLDDLRARVPHVGAALYAYEPGGPVTLELTLEDGSIFTFEGATEAAAVGRALAPMAPVEPPLEPAPAAVAPPAEPPGDGPDDIFA